MHATGGDLVAGQQLGHLLVVVEIAVVLESLGHALMGFAGPDVFRVVAVHHGDPDRGVRLSAPATGGKQESDPDQRDAQPRHGPHGMLGFHMFGPPSCHLALMMQHSRAMAAQVMGCVPPLVSS